MPSQTNLRNYNRLPEASEHARKHSGTNAHFNHNGTDGKEDELIVVQVEQISPVMAALPGAGTFRLKHTKPPQ